MLILGNAALDFQRSRYSLCGPIPRDPFYYRYLYTRVLFLWSSHAPLTAEPLRNARFWLEESRRIHGSLFEGNPAVFPSRSWYFTQVRRGNQRSQSYGLWDNDSNRLVNRLRCRKWTECFGCSDLTQLLRYCCVWWTSDIRQNLLIRVFIYLFIVIHYLLFSDSFMCLGDFYTILFPTSCCWISD